MRIEAIHDPDLGTIATAYNDDGAIVATAADSITHGMYVAADESAFYAATGNLLPPGTWEQECSR